MSDETIITTDTEVTPSPVVTPVASPASVPAESVLMVRDPEKVPGMGMTRMLVQPSQVADFEKTGWYRA